MCSRTKVSTAFWHKIGIFGKVIAIVVGMVQRRVFVKRERSWKIRIRGFWVDEEKSVDYIFIKRGDKYITG